MSYITWGGQQVTWDFDYATWGTEFPPTVLEHLSHLQDHPFLKKLQWRKGLSVVRDGNGGFKTTRYVAKTKGLTEGKDFFVGGHIYTHFDEDVRDELIASGFDPESL